MIEEDEVKFANKESEDFDELLDHEIDEIINRK